MELKFVKINDKYQLIDTTSKNVIEEYIMTETIDFNKLMNFLLTDELNNAFSLSALDFDPTDEEKTLYTLIEKIVKKYNENVSAYGEFLKSDL